MTINYNMKENADIVQSAVLSAAILIRKNLTAANVWHICF